MKIQIGNNNILAKAQIRLQPDYREERLSLLLLNYISNELPCNALSKDSNYTQSNVRYVPAGINLPESVEATHSSDSFCCGQVCTHAQTSLWKTVWLCILLFIESLKSMHALSQPDFMAMSIATEYTSMKKTCS